MNIYRITPENINDLKFSSPVKFDTILFDSNLVCNLHCVYCHNNRVNKPMVEDDLINFIENQVDTVKNFQIGCAMEPTMDKRMGKIATIVSKSRAKPTGFFRVQTNAILLHNHDLNVLKEAGITFFTISLDSVDKDVHSQLRGGSDLFKIVENIRWLRKNWPEVTIYLVTTVSTLNGPGLKDLADFAVDSGVDGIELRKMFYLPNSKIIKNHDMMSKLLMTDEQFELAYKPIVEEYRNKLKICINDAETIETHKKQQKVKV